jgi:uncharacterized protein YjbI with pentapeptide repeats
MPISMAQLVNAQLSTEDVVSGTAYISLRGANLTDANLDGANLVDANLEGSILVNTDFSNADLTNASLGTNQQFLDTVNFSNTICPSGTNSDSNGGNCNGELF